MDKKLRILHVPVEIAGQMGILSRAQRELGYHSYSCNYVKNWGDYECDENLNLEQTRGKLLNSLRIMRFSLGAVLKFDVFHFHFGLTLLPRYRDLALLKALGKKMVMQFWGSDIRLKSIAESQNRFIRVKAGDDKRKIDAVKHLSKYIDIAIVGDYELHEYVNGHFKKVVIIRQAVDSQEYKPAIPSKNNKKPVIVHAPTDKWVKGTEYVLEAVAKLEREHEIDFALVHRVPHQQAKQIYQKADITVDDILGGTYGVFPVEAMALGKPVICYIREDLRDTYPKELPIVSANPDNIYQQLKILIENPELRHELGLKGREYVERYHDSLKIARQLIELYKSV
jgi:glycosyltransferase involved in cell wall biosynthesis